MSNLLSTVFTLTSERDSELPFQNARMLQAAFLKWLQQTSPGLTAKLHDKNRRRPYTISNLDGDFRNDRGRITLRAGQKIWFRVTGVQAALNDAVRHAIEEQQCGPGLARPSLLPDAAHCTAEEHEWAAISSFGNIIENAQNALAQLQGLAPEATLFFRSPTCFFENNQSLPLPVPRFVFGYLLNEWQTNSPHELPLEDIQHFVDSIYLAYAKIETRYVHDDRLRRTGFIGTARFAIHPALPEVYRFCLHLLAQFAFFSGVGSHTALGMGQARFAPSRRRR